MLLEALVYQNGNLWGGGKFWHILIDSDMISIPTNFVGIADTPGIPTSFVGTAIPTMLLGTLHFD